ncbi:unnamed protein product [Protopolystoma xenopodis]|uniref:Uncharacterized protein n=1 Tax=Protopolystoma xenopodis TaxID=117903 RepID=A0A448XAI2_9PLAT|nr:unnamed protein product [Protopolystoma xenopodis]
MPKSISMFTQNPGECDRLLETYVTLMRYCPASRNAILDSFIGIIDDYMDEYYALCDLRYSEQNSHLNRAPKFDSLKHTRFHTDRDERIHLHSDVQTGHIKSAEYAVLNFLKTVLLLSLL